MAYREEGINSYFKDKESNEQLSLGYQSNI